MQGSNASWPVGGATRQSGGNWVGRFEKPEDWSIWASMYSSNLELGQLITVGDAILKWTATGVKFVDAAFAMQADLDSFCSKIGTPIAFGARASVNGVQYTYGAAGWVAASPIVLDRYLRVATFGDSTANFGSENTDYESRNPPFPGSGYTDDGFTASKGTLNPWGRLLFVACGGWSGQTTQQFLDRGKNAYATTRKALQDVLRKRPDVVLMHGGSINDYSGFTSSTPQATIDAVVSRHRQCVEFFTNNGIPVIDSGTYGYSNPGANLAAICAIIVQTNATIKVMAASNPLWHFIDTNGITHDGTGLYIPVVTDDKTHLNAQGGYRIGRAEKAIIDLIYAPGTSGDVIWDQQADYANATGSQPANTTYEVGAGVTASSTSIEATKCIVTATVTDYTTGAFTVLLSSPKTNSLAGVLAGNALALELYAVVRDSDGNIIRGTQFGSRIRLYNSTNDRSILNDLVNGVQTGGEWMVRQFSSPVAAADLGSSTQIRTTIYFPANGVYTVEFRPWMIRMITPINPLP